MFRKDCHRQRGGDDGDAPCAVWLVIRTRVRQLVAQSVGADQILAQDGDEDAVGGG